MEHKKIIEIPQAIHSTKEGFNILFESLKFFLDNKYINKTIVVDFKKNTWFDANLLPVLYAFIAYGHQKLNIQGEYRNHSEDKLHKILIRNNFAKVCFGLEHSPKEHETVVPFKVFRASDTYGFGEYIDSEIVRYFPSMEDQVKKDLSGYIQELFGNAQIHGLCDKVFTCGQYYRHNHKMDFTIVDMGRTIGENVESFLQDTGQTIPKSCIAWAIEPQNSTKRTNSGGIGLSLMHDFIYYNNGKFQIISGNEYWELNAKKVEIHEMSICFPGTIVNIEIDQNDNNYYKYETQMKEKELF